MTSRKKIIRTSAVAIGAILLVMLAFPMAIKDRLVKAVRIEINKNLNAKVDFSDAHVSLLSDFPNFQLALDSLHIEGIDQFKNTELLTISKLRVSISPLSLLKNVQAPKVSNLSLTEPKLKIVILEDGKANYEIIKEEAEGSESSDFVLELKSYGISDGSMSYVDQSTATNLILTGIDHSGSGVLSSDIFDLDTDWLIEHLSLEVDDVNYIKDSKVEADAVLGIDLNTSTYTFKDNIIKINGLDINIDGYIAQKSDGLDINLDFASPSDDVHQFLSLIPGVYQEGLKDIETRGRLALSGNARGTYVYDSSQYPSFQVNLNVEDGVIQSNQAQESIEALNADISVGSGTGNPDDITIDAQKLNFSMQGLPFSARLRLSDILSNPHAEGRLQGELDLATLASIIPLSNVESLSGRLKANTDFVATYSDIESESYEDLEMNGNLDIDKFTLLYADYPEVKTDQVALRFSPQRISLAETTVFMGRSDLRINGHINNVLALIKPNATLDGAFSLSSSLVDLREWMDVDSAHTETASEFPATALSSALKIDGNVEQMHYDDYTLKNLQWTGSYGEGTLVVDPLNFEIDDSDLSFRGQFSGIVDYFMEGGTLQGSGTLLSKKLNLDALYGEPTTDKSEQSAPYPLPEDLLLDLGVIADHLVYDGLDLMDVEGHVLLEAQELIMERATARSLGGTLGFSGSYQTLPKQKPAFSMKFDATDLDFQQTFATIPFLKKLAPIGAFMQGELKSNLVLQGDLHEDQLYPDLMSLSGSGLLETVNSAISRYAPLEKVSELLGIKELSDLKNLNSKNWFSLEQGRLDVEPFEIVLDELDVTLEVTGSQFLNGGMDYLVVARMPRDLLRQNQITGQIDRGYGLVLKRAQELGLNLEDSEYVTLQITVGGAYDNPSAKLKVVDAEGRTADQVLSQAVEEKTEELKDSVRLTVEKKVKSVQDSLLREGSRTVDSLEQRIKEEAEDKLDDQKQKLVDSILARTGIPSLGDSTGSKVNDIKEKLKDFNPFKNRKKSKEEAEKRDSTVQKQ